MDEEKDITVPIGELERVFSAAQAKRLWLNKKSFVYVVCWRQRGPCKVGITDDITPRLVGLQSGNPFRLHVWRLFEARDAAMAFAIEQKVLDRLAPLRMCGEWVNVTAPQLTDIVVTCFSLLGQKAIPSDGKKQRKSNRKTSPKENARRMKEKWRRIKAEREFVKNFS